MYSIAPPSSRVMARFRWLLPFLAISCTKSDSKVASDAPPDSSAEEWRVADSPFLVIGKEGATEYEFGDIVGLGKLESAEWVLYDRGGHQLRFYDSVGKY